MYDFGLGYLYRLYNQIKKIYKIKTQLDTIFNNGDNVYYVDKIDVKQIENFESLKQNIFSCGSLYIKFFQWYVSKLKSNIININTKPNIETSDSSESLDKVESVEQSDPPEPIHNKKKNDNLIKFIKYFEDIFEQCPYHDIEHTKKTFFDSMNGISLEKYVDISTFKTIASGSIGQVYYGHRLEDNLEIAIKVKHPDITKDLHNQYEIIKFIKLVQKIPFLRNYLNIYFNIDDFLLDINLQCDFNNEANNCKIFQKNFKDSSKYIIFPDIIYQSEDLLISEYVEGDSFENLTDMQKYNTSINFICFFYQMLLVDNFLHGDLHCKNWKVRNNKETNTVQIIVYDCGICFQNTNLDLTKEFWFSLLNYDVDKLKKIMIQFIHETTDNINVNDKQIEYDINIFFNNVLKNSLSTSLLIKLIIDFFRSNNIIVHKFLLNFSILMCVIEEFLKDNNILNKDKKNLKRSSMFELMNELQLDMIAFCDIKKCYPKIRDIFSLDMNTKYKYYKSNLIKNNINEIKNTEKKLFISLTITPLKFKSPE